jgi:Lysylphosphatidylglycerol synthase TM region
MQDKLDAVVRSAVHAIGLIADRTASVDVRALLLGTLLFLVAQAVRTRGWWNILRAAYPDATGLRARDVTRAYLAGAGANSLVPARGGDVVKLALVHRRIPGARYPTLVATFVPETLFETAIGTALVVWAFAKGFLPIPRIQGELPSLDVSLLVEHPIQTLAGVVLLGVGCWLVARRLRAPLAQGMAILRTPMRFVTGVASWQALARLIRLGAFAAFMAAFGLPVTTATVVLVMAAQGGGRIMPLAPASAGLRLAMLSYGFVEVTGHPIDIAAITAFTFGVSAVMATSGLMVAAVILAQEFGTLSPRRALATVRGTARPALGAGWDVHDVDAQAGAVVRSRGGLRRLHPGRLLRVRPLRRPHPAAVVQHEPVP